MYVHIITYSILHKLNNQINASKLIKTNLLFYAGSLLAFAWSKVYVHVYFDNTFDCEYMFNSELWLYIVPSIAMC